MATPAVTREYNPGSRRNWRKTMKLPPRCEMRPDSPAMHAEQCLVPNQTAKESILGWQDNTDASGGEVGDQASLSSFHRDTGIPINFQEESGLGTF